MTALYIQCQPNTLSQIVGQDSAVKELQGYIDRDTLTGNAFWITGSSGTGKTTLAKILSEMVSGCVETITGTRINTDWLRRVDMEMRHSTLPLFNGKTGHAYIINEAHGIRDKRLIETFLDVLEDAAERDYNVLFIFTTTTEGQLHFEGLDDASPFLSRCKQINLSRRPGVDTLAAAIYDNAKDAGYINGQPRDDILRQITTRLKKEHNNMRAVYQWIETGVLA